MSTCRARPWAPAKRRSRSWCCLNSRFAWAQGTTFGDRIPNVKMYFEGRDTHPTTLWACYNCDSSTIRVRFERDSSTIRARHATTCYEVFRALAYEIDSSTPRESVVGVSCMLIDSSMHTAFTLYLYRPTLHRDVCVNMPEIVYTNAICLYKRQYAEYTINHCEIIVMLKWKNLRLHSTRIHHIVHCMWSWVKDFP